MITDIKAKVAQVTPVVTGEADLDYVKMTKLGAMFTAGWRTQLLLAGKVWSVEVGDVAADGDVDLLTGGGNGTTIDMDQPELVIGVDAGYYLIPLEARCSIQADNDADLSEANIVLFADRAAAPVTTNASGTLFTPINMLDGAGAFPGRAWVGSTGDITTPVTSQILDYVTQQTSSIDTTTVVAHPIIKMEYLPDSPPILAGPCQVVLCWGATKAALGIGIVVVAAVPTSYFPVS